MKFAICNETFVDWPLDKAFALARDCGYTGIEIAPFTLAADVCQITPQMRRHVRQQADAAGLEVVGLHWLLAKTEGYHLTSPEETVRARTAEYLKELARCCRDMGGSVLVFGSPQQRNLMPDVEPEQGLEYAAEIFRAAMPVLVENEVTLAVEPLGPAEGNFLLTAEQGARLVEMIGSPFCRLHLDCKAMSSEPTPIPQIIHEQSQRLVHFHANDANKLGPGFGDLDFVPILSALREIKYPGWVSVEVFDYTPGVERLARESIDYMKACLAKIDG